MTPKDKKRKAFAEEREILKKGAECEVIEKDGIRRFSYDRGEGFDYELYKEIQTLGNKAKLDRQWVPKDHIQLLSKVLLDINPDAKKGVCHGTRQGFEQAWFMENIPNSDVFGTEISETATEFPNTIQWDFHDIKEEWIGAFDFIYSNSWDHSYDIELLFANWGKCVKSSNGVMFIDHGWFYLPERVSAMDPIGVELNVLVDMLNKLFDTRAHRIEIIEGAKIGRRGSIDTIAVVFEG